MKEVIFGHEKMTASQSGLFTPEHTLERASTQYLC
jgi:hypothetical protein